MSATSSSASHNTGTKEYSSVITIRFPSSEEALIMKSVLEVDEELAPLRLTRKFELNKEELIV
jgi:hypothetical protein